MAVLVFYSTPLFSPSASIQWDAVDVHYSAQKYFSEAMREARLPFWTPFIFSGMPFMADPQVGAWYPLNWPFFLLRITPRAIEWETALHCFLGAFGAFLFAREILASRWAGVFCGGFYALSGFFAGHSSHSGIFATAALFPWLLWAGMRAARSLQWLPVLAITAGIVVLAGHFQTALYACCALAVLLMADIAISGSASRRRVRNALRAIGCVLVSAMVLPSVMTLPGLELTSQSERAGANYTQSPDAVLVPGALLTIVRPDHYHAPGISGYSGPRDITQFYFYQGVLVVPWPWWV